MWGDEETSVIFEIHNDEHVLDLQFKKGILDGKMATEIECRDSVRTLKSQNNSLLFVFRSKECFRNTSLWLPMWNAVSEHVCFYLRRASFHV